jgi:hypothetical protein
MFAVAEAQRILALGPLAVHVEPVWVGEHLFVPVGGLVGGDDAVSGFDVLLYIRFVKFGCNIAGRGCLCAYLAAELEVELSCAFYGEC